MLRYLVRRLAQVIPTLLGVAVVTFFMLRIVPGDIVEVKLRGDGGNVSQAQIEVERKRLGLDQPLPVQFASWMAGLVTLDLGKSMWTGNGVAEEIGLRLELSLQVAVMATMIAILIAVPLGTLSALFMGTWIDYAIRMVTIAGLAVPSFWLGMLVILGLLYLFNWLPPITFTSFYKDPIANLSQLIWPALAVGYRYAAVVARMIRSSIIEVLKEDYIRTARAKGLPEWRVIAKHAMANVMIPVVTVIGIILSVLISGSVVIESVFSVPGIGSLLGNAILRRDYPMIQGGLLFVAASLMLLNIAVDLLYAYFDPRVRYDVGN